MSWRGLDEHEHQATAEAQASLAKEFMLEGTVGDQDWLTLLAWKQPQLVHLLPCQFNVQTDQVPDLVNYYEGFNRTFSGLQHGTMGGCVGQIQELPQSDDDQTRQWRMKNHSADLMFSVKSCH